LSQIRLEQAEFLPKFSGRRNPSQAIAAVFVAARRTAALRSPVPVPAAAATVRDIAVCARTATRELRAAAFVSDNYTRCRDARAKTIAAHLLKYKRRARQAIHIEERKWY
jgi:hypothetical protein